METLQLFTFVYLLLAHYTSSLTLCTQKAQCIQRGQNETKNKTKYVRITNTHLLDFLLPKSSFFLSFLVFFLSPLVFSAIWLGLIFFTRGLTIVSHTVKWMQRVRFLRHGQNTVSNRSFRRHGIVVYISNLFSF